MVWLLLITGLLGRGSDLPERVGLYAPCEGVLPTSPALVAMESLAHSRLDLELVRLPPGLEGFVRLSTEPLDLLLVHSLGSAKMVVAACYEQRAQRDEALRLLRANGLQSKLRAQPWEWVSAQRTVYLLGVPRTRWLTEVAAADRTVYLHLEGEAPHRMTPAGFYRLPQTTTSPLGHAFAVRDLLLPLLPAPVEPPPTPVTAAAARNAPGPKRPDLWVLPRDPRVVTPGTLAFEVRNTGSAPTPPLQLAAVVGGEGLRLSMQPATLTIEPGQSVSATLQVDFDERALAGHRTVVLELSGAMGRQTYARYWDVGVIVDRPPLISAPSSVLFTPEQRLFIDARDPDLMAVHMEALVPQGLHAEVAGGRVTVTFPRWSVPDDRRPDLRVLAWSGPDRSSSRMARHDVAITGTEGHPRPWIVIIAWATGLFAIGLGALRELLRGWLAAQSAAPSSSSR